MKVSVSFLKRNKTLEETIRDIDNSICDYIHVDVCDGKFTQNVVLTMDEVDKLSQVKHKLDVHLMCEDPYPYIVAFSKLNTDIITIQSEIKDVYKNLFLIKLKGIKCGLALKPSTSVESIKSYLPFINNCIILGVNPGIGGKSLIPETILKIKELVTFREKNNLHYTIAFDGGINDQTIREIELIDTVIVGSYVVLSDNINDRIQSLK